MTISTTVKWAVVGLALAGVGWTVYTLRASAAADQALSVAEQRIDQHAAAAATTRSLQSKVDQANATLRALEAERRAVRERLAAAEQRVLDSTPDERALTDATAEALRDYAASLDRDFADCRELVVRLGDEAAAASEAAHALDQGWPTGLDLAAQAAAFKGLK